MSNRLRLQDHNAPTCAAPIGVGDLCCLPTSCCDEATIDGLDLTAWHAYINDGLELPLEAYTADEIALLVEAQNAIDDAWQTVDSRTCSRFKPGQCAIVRLCPPTCPPCPPCDKCSTPVCYDLGELCQFIDFRYIDSAHFVAYAEDGTATAEQIDLPNGELLPCARWRFDRMGSQLSLCPQRLTKDEHLSALHENDMSLAFGRPCTSGLVLHYSDAVPPEVRHAVRDVACIELEKCHEGRCKRIPDEVASVSNDGTTYNFERPDAEQLAFGDTGIKSLNVAASKYGCTKTNAGFWSPCEPESIVRDVRFTCECPELPEVSC